MEDVESLEDKLTDMHNVLCSVPHDVMHKLGLQEKNWANKGPDWLRDIRAEKHHITHAGTCMGY